MNKKRIRLLALLLALLMLLCACGKKSSVGSTKITVEEAQELANSSTSMMEMIQSLFDGVIFYTNEEGNVVYKDVDKTLKLNDYNFKDNLYRVDTASFKKFGYFEKDKQASLNGIDVSRYQGGIEWDKVKADNIEFAIIQLGYRGYETGKLVFDSKYEYNIKGALENDIPVGVYFVTQAISVDEAIDEADFILNAIKPYNVTWPIVYDVEAPGGANGRAFSLTKEERTEIICAFCEHIKEAGYTPMIYANIRWFLDYMDLSKLEDYEKWFAQYRNKPFFPYEFGIWQYSDSASVSGIRGNVDFNLSFKDYGKK